jgi:pimeloyl-ACP methyl ester carboxylesterase
MASVQLTHGMTEYELEGPEGGPLVLLLHGGSVPMWTWDRQVPALGAAGFRTLRYDMYGKGKSAKPSVAYDRDLFKGQLLDLLEQLGVKDPVHLVGFSFGGATATNFTAAHPDKVRTLALIAPVFRFDEGNTLVRAARIPVVGELFMRFVVMKKGADRASRLWSGAEGTERYAALFRNQLGRPGFEQAFLSFLRSNALGDYSAAYRELGQAGRKALLIWGTSDEDIPAAHIERIRKLVPLARYHELPGISHGAVFQAPTRINALLLGHLLDRAVH